MTTPKLLPIGCPLCGGTDLEKFSERDTQTGTSKLLTYCRTCGCCAPPASWNHRPALESAMLRAAEAAFRDGSSCPDFGAPEDSEFWFKQHAQEIVSRLLADEGKGESE